MKTTTLQLCGQEVRIAYCAASENGFEDISGKSITDIDFRSNRDLLNLALACIIAAYAADDQDSPVTAKDLLYKATPQELTELYKQAFTLRAEWYGLPKVVADQLNDETAQMTDEEKEQAAKNAEPPTTAT